MQRNEPTPDAHRTPYVPNETAHPWRRMVSIGDSFTEGIGDPLPGPGGGHRGWADRVAEVLGAQVDDFAYAGTAAGRTGSRRCSALRSTTSRTRTSRCAAS